MCQPVVKNTSAQFTISTADIPLGQKLRELSQFLLTFVSNLWTNPSMEGVFADLAEYEEVLRAYTGNTLKDARALEIGFGARPIRMFALSGMGADVWGVDLDVPLLKGRPREVFEMYRRNGAERAVKSMIRFALFDLLERRRLDAALRRRGSQLQIQPDRLLIGDVLNLNVTARSLDLIYAEDVFEHIPPASLAQLIPKMEGWLKPTGLALVRPCVFTGIAGGHLAEWFPHLVSDIHRRRRSEPWEHLRLKRFGPNTYLNELSLAQYRRIFKSNFEILEQRVREPRFGTCVPHPVRLKGIARLGRRGTL